MPKKSSAKSVPPESAPAKTLKVASRATKSSGPKSAAAKKITQGKPAASAKKAAAAKKPPIVVPSKKAEVSIDHPSTGEKIGRHHYAIRISCALPSCRVEISFDGKQWIPCRDALGFWWYDWCSIPEGEHAISARVVDADGSLAAVSETIVCVSK